MGRHPDSIKELGQHVRDPWLDSQQPNMEDYCAKCECELHRRDRWLDSLDGGVTDLENRFAEEISVCSRWDEHGVGVQNPWSWDRLV